MPFAPYTGYVPCSKTSLSCKEEELHPKHSDISILALWPCAMLCAIPLIRDCKFNRCAIIENVLNNCHDNKMRLGDVGIYIRGLTYSSNDVVEQKGTIVMRSNNIVSGGLLDYCNNVVRVNK